MTNNPLSKRAEKALAILEEGGKFCERLERNSYTGREQFRIRLINAEGRVVSGIGHATYSELKTMVAVINGGTTVSTYYGLRTVHDPAKPDHF